MITRSGLAFQKRISQTRISWNSFKLLNKKRALPCFEVEEEGALRSGVLVYPGFPEVGRSSHLEHRLGGWGGGRQREDKD